MAKWNRKKCEDCIVGYHVDGYGEDGMLLDESDIEIDESGDESLNVNKGQEFTFCPICGNLIGEEERGASGEADREVNSLL